MPQALHVENVLHTLQECPVAFRLRQFADQPRSGIFAFLRGEPAQVLQAELRGDPVVHAAGRIIQAGMGGINGDARRQRAHHATLLVGGVGDLAETLEQQRMMRNNHVASAINRFTHNFFRDIQAN